MNDDKSLIEVVFTALFVIGAIVVLWLTVVPLIISLLN